MLNLRNLFQNKEFIKLYQTRFFLFLFTCFKQIVQKRTKKQVIVSKKTYKKVPLNRHIRQISFRWSAAHINARFGRASKMNFKTGAAMEHWKVCEF